MQDRDPGTIASTVAAICIREKEASHIVRVHNVADMKQGIVVMDAIRNAK
jgi:dihydropteroate synthase